MQTNGMTDHVTHHGKQIAIIISASLAGFMVLLDSNIVNISLPVMAAYFSISTGEVIQVALVYLLVLTSTLIIFGKLAEIYGIKRIFITGFALFTFSSFLCGISGSFIPLLLFRTLQALGGSMLYATSLTMITRFIPPDRRGWAFGIFSPLSSLGMLIGNPLGGLITGLLNWHWIFLVNIPFGLLAIMVAWKAMPNDHRRTEQKRSGSGFDFAGSLLSFSGLALLVLFVSKGKDFGWTSWTTVTGLVVSVILLVSFVWWENRSRDPILDPDIFRHRSFAFAILASVTGFGLMAGSSVLLPFYLTSGLHIDVEHAGFILMTFPVLFSLFSPVTGRLSDRMSMVRLTMIGMTLAAVSCLLFAWLLPRAHLGVLFGYMVLLGLAYALFITPNNNLVMSLAREDKQAVSSSVFKLATNLGQMIGLILMQMVFTAVILHGHPGETGLSLTSTPEPLLMQGFSRAFIAGAAICVLTVILSFFISEKGIRRQVSEEMPFLG